MVAHHSKSEEEGVPGVARPVRHHRRTAQRRLILRVFEEAACERGKHLSIDQIGERLEAVGSPINRSTIYRNIDWMLALGVLQVNRLLGEGTTYELATPPAAGGPHVHLVCRRCLHVEHGEASSAETTPERLSSPLESQPEELSEFHPIAQTLTITGYCSACWHELANGQ